ncbi:MAG: DNA mismatch repair endonuclease MutL [Deltaproteobacteria bacterium]|nr:DNA mismatch repair endonuclease MutL [Deltaproteobacteria bacterium]
MNVIRVLPEQVASQIAAGEVIDRPASIVKELIENSVDARARRITVRIAEGGKRLIKVSDNGVGMSRDDLLLSVERHATSKLREADELSRVKSLGFRGEALPSMAAVSKMQITSLPPDQVVGYRLTVSGGKPPEIAETGTPPGTIVEVKDLFFNMPARRKFLRTSRTELGHIIEVMGRAAMPFPEIHFSLVEGTRSILTLPASTAPLERLAALMGREVGQAMTEGEECHDGIRIQLYAAPPEYSRNRGDRLYVYVNGRNIRDRLVTRAIMEGYGQRLMKGKYPQIVLFLEMDPSQVDVNVHPTKQEVRFRETHKVFHTIVSAINSRLTPASPSPWRTDPLAPESPPESPFLPFAEIAEPGSPPYGKAEGMGTVTQGPLRPGERTLLNQGTEIIGQLGSTYILCQVQDGLLMVDQHAAHERIVYEHLRSSLKHSQIQIQTLLLPPELELTSKEKQIALDQKERLDALGIDLAHFGGNTFILRSVPAMLENISWSAFVSELLAQLTDGPSDDMAVLDKGITVMACHGAVRAGQRMSLEEMHRLMDELNETELPTNCPHGRPVFRHFSYLELEKMFKRVI